MKCFYYEECIKFKATLQQISLVMKIIPNFN